MVGEIVAVDGQHGVVFLCHLGNGEQLFGGIGRGERRAELAGIGELHIHIGDLGIVSLAKLDADGHGAIVVGQAILAIGIGHGAIGGRAAQGEGAFGQGKGGQKQQRAQQCKNAFHVGSLRSI